MMYNGSISALFWGHTASHNSTTKLLFPISLLPMKWIMLSKLMVVVNSLERVKYDLTSSPWLYAPRPKFSFTISFRVIHSPSEVAFCWIFLFSLIIFFFAIAICVHYEISCRPETVCRKIISRNLRAPVSTYFDWSLRLSFPFSESRIRYLLLPTSSGFILSRMTSRLGRRAFTRPWKKCKAKLLLARVNDDNVKFHWKCRGNPRLSYCKLTITQSRVSTALTM